MRIWQIVLLGLYSICIIAIELSSGQPEVRHYLTDIRGPVLLYGLNTSLTTILLILTAYNFWLGWKRNNSKEIYGFDDRNYFLLQSLIFIYLALDERFMIHERAAFVLGIHDAFPLIGVAVVELFVLWKFQALNPDKPGRRLIYISATLFALMMLIDAFGGSDRVLRLSLEDLTKLWAIFCLFLYSWRVLNFNGEDAKSKA